MLILDDKAIIAIGEPARPVSATARQYNRCLAPLDGATVVALDHDFHVCGIIGVINDAGMWILWDESDTKYNSKKSAVLVCKSQYMKHFDAPSFNINGETIKEVDHVKYMGHFIYNTL